MKNCAITQQDALVVEELKKVLEGMKVTPTRHFCDQRRFGYHFTRAQSEFLLEGLITYELKEEAVLVNISFNLIVPKDRFRSAYAHLNEVNSDLIFGQYTLCRDCGSLNFNSGVLIKTQDLFRERIRANLERFFKDAYRGFSYLSKCPPVSVQDNSKEVKNI